MTTESPELIKAAFLQLPGLNMHLITAGRADGPPIILLHGFPEFWYSWRYQIPALAAAGFRVIVPDQRGYNLTDKHGPYDFVTLASDIAHLQDAIGVTRSHIVGHDWGGGIAWAFASLFPERTNSLIVMNAPHFNAYADTLRHQRNRSQALKSWYMAFFQLPLLPELTMRFHHYALLRQGLEQIAAGHMSAGDIAMYIDACAHPGALTAMIGWYRAAARYILRHSACFPNFHIGAPTLVIWGENDFALDKACNDTLDLYVDRFRIAYLPQASHWVQMDAPAQVNHLLLEHLHDQ